MMNGLFIAGAALRMANKRTQEAGDMASGTGGAGRMQNGDVQLDVEKLFMITEALWKMVKEQHGYTDEQPKPPCPQCGRTLMGKHPVCLYCGAVAVRAPFER